MFKLYLRQFVITSVFFHALLGAEGFTVTKSHVNLSLKRRNNAVTTAKSFSSSPCDVDQLNFQESISSTSIFSSQPNVNNDETITSQFVQITIEYCAGCRWGLRAFWMAQELLTTFSDIDSVQAITLFPSRPPADGGRYVVRLHRTNSLGEEVNTSDNSITLWDRYDAGRFPELKELKRLIRDQIDPKLFLGHSDSIERQINTEVKTSTELKSTGIIKPRNDDVETVIIPHIQGSVSPNIAIQYCTGCRWLLRAGYYGQELLLSTFEDELNSITLIPSRPPLPGGILTIQLDDKIIWNRINTGRFPESKELKKLIRNEINPMKDLGHIDGNKKANEVVDVDEELEDEDAEEARKFFGVL